MEKMEILMHHNATRTTVRFRLGFLAIAVALLGAPQIAFSQG
jgi:ABC-type uncharacterized transport system permease subunit